MIFVALHNIIIPELVLKHCYNVDDFKVIYYSENKSYIKVKYLKQLAYNSFFPISFDKKNSYIAPMIFKYNNKKYILHITTSDNTNILYVYDIELNQKYKLLLPITQEIWSAQLCEDNENIYVSFSSGHILKINKSDFSISKFIYNSTAGFLQKPIIFQDKIILIDYFNGYIVVDKDLKLLYKHSNNISNNIISNTYSTPYIFNNSILVYGSTNSELVLVDLLSYKYKSIYLQANLNLTIEGLVIVDNCIIISSECETIMLDNKFQKIWTLPFGSSYGGVLFNKAKNLVAISSNNFIFIVNYLSGEIKSIARFNELVLRPIFMRDNNLIVVDVKGTLWHVNNENYTKIYDTSGFIFSNNIIHKPILLQDRVILVNSVGNARVYKLII